MSSRWYVAAVQPKSEAFAKVNLVRQGFRVYSPRVRVRKVVDGRSYDVQEPLLCGYLLIRFDRDVDRWRSINGTRGVVKLLPISAEVPQPIPDELVDKWVAAEIEGVVSLDDAVTPMIEYQPGQDLRVLEGPFSDFTGTCISSSKGRVALLLGLFGRKTVVEMEPCKVELA
ncbi:MAG: hypothetical protein F8N37_12115 [Telmatospirillum sp.]|nr:hypothetical protein [Telmatospirillum sp.]